MHYLDALARCITSMHYLDALARCTEAQYALVCKDSEAAEEHNVDDPWVAPREVVLAALAL